MNKYLQAVYALMLLVMGGACREIYYPEGLESDLKIPVIQGNILEHEAPVVTLSWAMAYEGQSVEYISGATVVVSNDFGSSVVLNESSAGTYTCEAFVFKGELGNSYTLQVTLPDGSEYSSNVVPMLEKPVMDSLYAKPEIKTIHYYNSTEDMVLKERKGLSVYADVHGNSSTPLYYRFHTKLIKESVYTVDIGSPASHPVYMWEVSWIDHSFTVEKATSQFDRQVIRKHSIGFFEYFYNAALQTETSTAPFTMAWIFVFNVYSISNDVYEYYHSIGQQLASKDQLFAPVPAQVKSNIKCSSDPGKKVIGIFEASALTTYYKAFGWRNMDDYYEMELDTFPDLEHGGRSPRYMPDFWITF